MACLCLVRSKISGTMMRDKETTSAEKLLNRLKNNRWIAWLIVAGGILIAISHFGEAVSKLAPMLPQKAQFDAYSTTRNPRNEAHSGSQPREAYNPCHECLPSTRWVRVAPLTARGR